MALLAGIALDNTALYFDKVYDYLIPDALLPHIKEGSRVFVPFGKADKKRLGFILSVHEGDGKGKKSIYAVLDDKPYLNDELLKTILFLKERYFCTYYDALKAVLPRGVGYSSGEVLCANKKLVKKSAVLSADALKIYEYLYGLGSFVSRKKIESLYQKYNVPLSERAKQLEGGLFLTLSPALMYDTRDSATITRHGTMASLRFDESIGLNGFDKTNGKLTGMIKQYIPIAKKSSLSLSVKGGGAIHGHIPEVMAYRLGGPYSIRGFKMSGVGTGNAFIMGSAEFATPIPFMDRTRIAFLNNLRFTLWLDAGKVFNETVSDKIYDRPMYAVSAGVGLKVFIPGMGPLSIDYGIPLTNPGRNGSKSGYFTFGVGDLMY